MNVLGGPSKKHFGVFDSKGKRFDRKLFLSLSDHLS
jgi:hypothetical protein